MSHTRTMALLCACAFVANVAADPALPPVSRMENKETKIRDVVHEAENSIIVKKIPIAYFYPFSLWPLPKAFPTSKDLKELEEQRRALEIFPGQEPTNRQRNNQKRKRERNRRNQDKNKSKR
ncbi:uncharacterized protein LOC113234658 [Hyposmocoma kahamanoa]|uniref:uncharacterized protein LOC113234658 n=1 Tax=Hyposmocoma kahamanoa TaxID=1477025 RepID=UPI000E6D5E21|nr:uncharacterized protein LOC113234658 [Hyposmocoma kahamanoa]